MAPASLTPPSPPRCNRKGHRWGWVAMLGVLSLWAASTLACGAVERHAVASLAQSQISLAARAEVDRLQETGETLVSISTWADEHRNPSTAPWHYVNFPRDSCTYDAERDCPGGKCVVAAIRVQINPLTSPHHSPSWHSGRDHAAFQLNYEVWFTCKCESCYCVRDFQAKPQRQSKVNTYSRANHLT